VTSSTPAAGDAAPPAVSSPGVPGAPAGPATPVARSRVAAWAAWDWGSAAFNAVVTTFVFTTWITSEAFVEAGTPDAGAVVAQHTTWLGWGLTAAGFVVALLAPALGALADASGRRRLWLGVNTAAVVVATAAMFLVRPEAGSLSDAVILGVVLLSVGNVFFELASVAYNAMLLDISTPATIGRVSGIGWGAGYVGGIVLLLVLFVGFISPDVGWFGVTGADGLDIRVSVLLSALWFAVFAVPVLVSVPDPVRPPGSGVSFLGAYRRLGRDLAHLWRERRATLWFLVASAVYRDGLAGVFTFGAVVAVGTFGFSASEVIVFAIAANVVAGLSTVAAGWLDDRVGPRVVVVGSLVGLVVAGLAVFVLHDGGQGVFWSFGLLLTAFVGPAQSASRALLARLAEPERATEAFGLYATTGRAASFLAPLAFSTLVAATGTQAWGVVGLVLVLAVGLVLLLLVRLPASAAPPGRRPRGAAAPGQAA
jgi:UMF1 family MFS transporter